MENGIINTWVTVRYAAEYLNLSKRRIQILCKTNRFIVKKMGRIWIIDPVSLIDFKNSRENCKKSIL